MNVICITGRLVRDPDIKTANETTIADFDIACTRNYKDKNTGKYESDFFRVKAFGNTATFVDNYIRKGVKVEIEGSLTQERWTDKEGKKRERIVINANNVRFAESKNTNQPHTVSSEQSLDEKKAAAKDMGFMEIPDSIDEDLPFS